MELAVLVEGAISGSPIVYLLFPGLFGVSQSCCPDPRDKTIVDDAVDAGTRSTTALQYHGQQYLKDGLIG